MSTPRTRRTTRRDLQAQQTRRDIVAAARRLFAERGYAATSMADIAAEANVAIQTIYASVGPKQALVQEMVELIDEEAEIPVIAAQLAETRDPDEMLALAARLTRQVVDRCGDIVRTIHAGAGTEPAIAAALAEGRRRHREGMAGLAAALAAGNLLAEGVTAGRATEILAVLTANETYFQLQRDFGMPLDEAEHWVLTALRRLLLPG